MRFKLRVLLPLLLVLVLAGCSKTASVVDPGSSGSSADRSEVEAEVARQSAVVEDGFSESADQIPVESASAKAGGSASAKADGSASAQGGGLATSGEIHPVFFWRHIRDVERLFEIAFSDTDSTGRPTRAVVTVHKVFRGSFNIVERDPNGLPDEAHVIRKPLVDHWVRRVLLRRLPIEGTDRRAWKIVACSGVEITSRDAKTDIVSLRVRTRDQDTTITDPLAFQRLRAITRLEPGEEVQLTVTTLAPDDVVLLYTRGQRSRFHNNGDNTYQGVWKAPERRGLYHAGVNALSHGTLFDSEAPYDSKAWILPYLVKPEELGDYAL